LEPHIKQYLGYDLADTELLADYLMPSVYYQQIFVPGLSVQSLAITGNGKKWQLAIEAQYPNEPLPEPSEPVDFQGGLTAGVAGLHRNVSKIDVASLYPSIMLKYGIGSEKDRDDKMLSILDYLLTERLRLKKLAKSGDREADQKQGALKVLINSAYGFLGTTGVGFNDYCAAALVTAYGRAIATRMIETIEAAGGTPIEVDTDGVMFKCPPGTNDLIFDHVSSAMPEGIKLEHEWQAQAVFIPKANDGTGLCKNYAVFLQDGIKLTGQFRKRDRSQLERGYPIEYLKQYIHDPEKAESYREALLSEIETGSLPTSTIAITRKIRRGEKVLLELGSVGDIVTYYNGKNGSFVSEGDYSRQFYLELLQEMRTKLLSTVDRELLESTQQNTQLCLF